MTRNCHELPGRWRLVRWLDRQHAAFARLPPRTVRLSGSYRMRVDPADENGRWVYVHGLERGERITRQFVRLLRPGDNVIDVGANVGYFTLVAARLVGPRGCVHAFEPSPQVFPRLHANARLNPAMNIRVHQQAVIDRCGDIRFHSASPARTGYSSIRDLGEQSTSVATVPAVSLDSMLSELPPTRLVKIDVEGAELLVLRGMRELIRRDRPFLIVELDDGFLRELDGSGQQVFELLKSAGYGLYRIVARGDLQPLDRAPTDRCNLLACPAEDHPAARAASGLPVPASSSGQPEDWPGHPSRAGSRGRRDLGAKWCPCPNQ